MLPKQEADESWKREWVASRNVSCGAMQFVGVHCLHMGYICLKITECGTWWASTAYLERDGHKGKAYEMKSREHSNESGR